MRVSARVVISVRVSAMVAIIVKLSAMGLNICRAFIGQDIRVSVVVISVRVSAMDSNHCQGIC